MLFPSPSFPVKEYGAALEEGYICPACRQDRLGMVEESQRLVCPACGGVFRQGWRRHTYAREAPTTLHGSPVRALGGFYETIQNYVVEPVIGLPADSTDQVPHVGDFVIDIDRETLGEAQEAVRKVHGFLDHVAPGQARLYYSGSKGFHVVLPYQTLGASPSATLCSREYRQLAGIVHRATGVEPDYKIYSPSRMLRMPDSWHPKTGLYKVELDPSEIDECQWLAQEPRGVVNTAPPELAEAAHLLYLEAVEAVEEQDRALGEMTPQFDFNPGGSGVPPCVTWIQQHGLPGRSTRHAVYMIMARYWKSSGVPLESYNSFNSLDQSCALSRARDFAVTHQAHTSTPQSVRVRDMEACVRYVYGQPGGFKCQHVQAIGLCQDHCSVKQISSHPLFHLLGIKSAPRESGE